MADPVTQITTAIDAIRRVAAADLIITRSAVLEIERQVGLIATLTQSAEIEREGTYLVARALGRRPEASPNPALGLDARLQGAIERFEQALRQQGFLPADVHAPLPGATSQA